MSSKLPSLDAAVSQVRELPLKISKELCQGKTYIVTGANVGLGKEAARHLVGIGARKVIMTVRNLEAGETARADIESSTGTKGVAEVWYLDLSDFDSVRAFASKAISSLERIDAVIKNAAVATGTREDGHLLAVKVNVIGTFLLAMLLLPKLRVDAKKFRYTPRISIVTGGAALDLGDYWKTIADDPIAMADADEEVGMQAYAISKLFEIQGVNEIARQLPVSKGGVIINSINPGLCETNLSRNSPQEFRDQLKNMWATSGRTAEAGSRTLLAGAVAGEDSHGSYMNDCATADNLKPGWLDVSEDRQAWGPIVMVLDAIEPGCVARALE